MRTEPQQAARSLTSSQSDETSHVSTVYFSSRRIVWLKYQKQHNCADPTAMMAQRKKKLMKKKRSPHAHRDQIESDDEQILKDEQDTVSPSNTQYSYINLLTESRDKHLRVYSF